MAKTTITAKHIDSLQTGYNENFVANPAVINMEMSSDTAVAVDTFVRSVIGLTNDTYGSVTIKMEKDISEWMEV